jgi:hypothetical protein
LGIKRTQLRPSVEGFHGVVPGKWADPVGCIDLPICFGTPSNFRKETLTFEVVGFHETYNTILGRPCYAKFMAVPNYTYLKLKMPSPKGVITIEPSYEHAYECDVECVEHEEAILESATLATDLNGLAKEIPDPKRNVGNFEPAEDIKLVPLDPASSDGRALKVSATLNPNRKQCSLTFSAQMSMYSRGVPRICRAYPGKSPSMPWRSRPAPNR